VTIGLIAANVISALLWLPPAVWILVFLGPVWLIVPTAFVLAPMLLSWLLHRRRHPNCALAVAVLACIPGTLLSGRLLSLILSGHSHWAG